MSTISSALELHISSMYIAINADASSAGATVEVDESKCYPILSMEIGANIAGAGGGGSNCSCTVIPVPISTGKNKDINHIADGGVLHDFTKVAAIGTKAAVIVRYELSDGVSGTGEIDEVMYVGFIGMRGISEEGGVASYSATYSIELVHPGVMITSNFIAEPYRFDVRHGNKLVKIHPMLNKNKSEAASSAVLKYKSNNCVDVCALVLSGLSAAETHTSGSSKETVHSVSDIVDTSTRPGVRVSSYNRGNSKNKLDSALVVDAFDATRVQSPWSILVNTLGKFGIHLLPKLTFDADDVSPKNKQTKFSYLATSLPFRSLDAEPNKCSISFDEILSYSLKPPAGTEIGSYAIAVDTTPVFKTDNRKGNAAGTGNTFIIINTGYDTNGKPFYICGKLKPEASVKGGSSTALASAITLTPITARGNYPTTVNKELKVFDLPNWSKIPAPDLGGIAKQQSAREKLAEFWGNVYYADSCNSFGSLGIKVPLHVALSLRENLGKITKVDLGNNNILVGMLESITYGITVGATGVSTSANVALNAVRTMDEDKILGLPADTIKNMYIDIEE